MGNELCVVHNGIIEGKWRIGEVESKIIAGIISRIGINDTEFKPMRFEYEDFFSLIGHSEDSKNHSKVREHLQGLQSKICSIKTETGWFDVQWIGGCKYDSTGVEIGIDKRFGPYLLDLKRNFTTFFLETSTKLKGAYSLQIYLLAKQYLLVGSRTMPIKDFRNKLGIGKKYENFKDLRIRIIEPSVKSINESSDIKLTITPTKRIRKAYLELLFEVSEKPKVKQIKKTPEPTNTGSETLKLDKLREEKLAEEKRQVKCEIRYLTSIFSRLSKDEQRQHRDACKMQKSIFPPLGDPEENFLNWWANQSQITFPESIYTEV